MHGWSNARAFSATQLTINPNAYFYRHVAPHEEQARCSLPQLCDAVMLQHLDIGEDSCTACTFQVYLTQCKNVNNDGAVHCDAGTR